MGRHLSGAQVVTFSKMDLDSKDTSASRLSIPVCRQFTLLENAFQGPTTFHLIQISSFANSTWAQNQGSGWLGDLQIHGWDSESGTAIFLKPWSKGNLSDEEVTELVEIFRVYLIGFLRVVQDHVSEFQLTYPFEIQGTAGCELLAGETTVSFLRGGLGGVDFMSLQNGTCVPAAEAGSRAQWFCTLYTQYQGISDIIGNLLYHTCPRFLWSVLEAGKAELQRQVKPEAWLSSGPPPGPGRLLLVCHVSGFYPEPVWNKKKKNKKKKNKKKKNKKKKNKKKKNKKKKNKKKKNKKKKNKKKKNKKKKNKKKKNKKKKNKKKKNKKKKNKKKKKNNNNSKNPDRRK
ncbi:T-cell surface glycoprotein CD1b [Myotis brandtii]|uniref:T-cell surface glycoprotein CD1b n=1 Tax=Myotis brandtii TaxID=109478 RepID=S7PAV6_MYOBR|nr:T-cell surface glycoprotein CD1b [Myotis brandtii]